jgi:hypothetical protein
MSDIAPFQLVRESARKNAPDVQQFDGDSRVVRWLVLRSQNGSFSHTNSVDEQWLEVFSLNVLMSILPMNSLFNSTGWESPLFIREEFTYRRERSIQLCSLSWLIGRLHVLHVDRCNIWRQDHALWRGTRYLDAITGVPDLYPGIAF